MAITRGLVLLTAVFPIPFSSQSAHHGDLPSLPSAPRGPLCTPALPLRFALKALVAGILRSCPDPIPPCVLSFPGFSQPSRHVRHHSLFASLKSFSNLPVLSFCEHWSGLHFAGHHQKVASPACRKSQPGGRLTRQPAPAPCGQAWFITWCRPGV